MCRQSDPFRKIRAVVRAKKVFSEVLKEEWVSGKSEGTICSR